MHGGARGSAAYVIHVDDKPALVVDMGGDTPLALAKAGIDAGTVDAVAISHLHPDHVSGLPAFMWNEVTAGRTKPLLLVGPPGGGGFPDFAEFWNRLFSAGGPFSDLGDAIRAGAFPTHIEVVGRASDASERSVGGGTLAAMRVHHGRAPTLAFRFARNGVSIVFAGDQTMRDPHFASFARKARIMVAHAGLTPGARGTALAGVMALPSDIGKVAQVAEVRRVVLGHLMGAPPHASNRQLWALADLERTIAEIAAHFSGEIVVAEDLQIVSARDVAVHAVADRDSDGPGCGL